MDNYESHLNDMLVRAYRLLEVMEGDMLRSSTGLDLSISEIHLLEAVGPPKKNNAPRTVSEISELLGISLPSVTLAINKLVRKDFVTKTKSNTDGRVVYIQLTRSGQKAEHAHRYFHRHMISTVVKDMSILEKDCLLKGITKLNTFFDDSIQKSEKRTLTNEL